jgi:hypothetical protein
MWSSMAGLFLPHLSLTQMMVLSKLPEGWLAILVHHMGCIEALVVTGTGKTPIKHQ